MWFLLWGVVIWCVLFWYWGFGVVDLIAGVVRERLLVLDPFVGWLGDGDCCYRPHLCGLCGGVDGLVFWVYFSEDGAVCRVGGDGWLLESARFDYLDGGFVDDLVGWVGGVCESDVRENPPV